MSWFISLFAYLLMMLPGAFLSLSLFVYSFHVWTLNICPMKMCVHVICRYVRACTCMYGCMCIRVEPEVNTGYVFPLLFSLFSEMESPTKPRARWVAYTDSELAPGTRLTPFLPQHGVTDETITPSFEHGCWDPKSGPRACMSGILVPEPFP